MGQALIYIGNSSSDGMPNTLLESIIMGAFPIQSNPGGATEEIIKDGENGLIINDSKNSEYIKELIKKAILNIELIESAFTINQMKIKPDLEIEKIKTEVINTYNTLKE
jgi:glycosyltransferase involved in cell wall biosynthesis